MKLKFIELEHTNPSLGHYEKKSVIGIAYNKSTADRINQFLHESIINNAVSIGKFINAYINKDEELTKKVLENSPKMELTQGAGISNLYFYFEDEIAPLILKDVYRAYSLSNFYPGFTQYMVNKGTRN